MELHYLKLIFTVILPDSPPDPYALFASRSGFETAFRQILGCRRGECAGCRDQAGCPFPSSFGQQLARDPEAVRRHQKPPLPFVFRFPLLPEDAPRETRCECSLTLFGTAIQHSAGFLGAARLLIEGMGGRIAAIEAECPGGGRTVVAEGGEPELPLLGSLDPSSCGPLPADRLTLHLVTPLKLVKDGRLLQAPGFSHLARALMRRISALAYYYEGVEAELDYGWLSGRSEAVRTVASEFRMVTAGGRQLGILGSATFQGELEPFHLLLQLGQATQLGKNASFGFGAYRLES
ncbi:CRISPR system precrRNA processing endoribonuclease RAMP protein Cas6 [Geomonas sp. Red32]|uniref:CRISPR system precrRNA processing endoribonuclease RAMP protein Cas6 n=1 Tax=Geomonas sp. Red32 TaxID=2912856 RepID=UPI00202D0139|nr:CRISPR system precrRNA processing endoribonuclease RAMP protein Cas6 [Geomonas sp. Red32]